MPAAVPVEEAVEIFNRLIKTKASEVDSVARAEWRLRALERQRPGDTSVGVAHLHALTMLGRAPEAIDLANRLWPARYSMGTDQFTAFLTELAGVGLYEQAAELLRELSDENAARLLGSMRPAIEVGIAWGLGDLDWLARAAPSGAWSEAVEQLRTLGFAPVLAERQQIVRSKTFGKQTYDHLAVTPGADVPLSLAHYCYTAGSYDERVQLEEEIQAALCNLFRPLGLEQQHWDVACEVIVPVTAAPPMLHTDDYSHAA